MTIIADHPLEHIFCVQFTYNKHKYYAYFQNFEHAQKNAHRYLLSNDFSNVEIFKLNITDNDGQRGTNHEKI